LDLDHSEVRGLLIAWRDNQRDVYAVVIERTGMQVISGKIKAVDDGVAVLSDTVMELRLPIGKQLDATITIVGDEVRSLTVAWPDGSAFLAVR
jgi:hypothetical protein